MIDETTTRDPERDPVLGAALRDLMGDVPEREVDWDAMRARIAASAELPLARMRPRSRWRGSATARVLVPLAAAAGIAALAVTGPIRSGVVGGGPSGDSIAAAPPAPTVDELVEAAVPEQVGDLISGQADREALLSAAVGS